MNLRKISQQSYLQSKKLNVKQEKKLSDLPKNENKQQLQQKIPKAKLLEQNQSNQQTANQETNEITVSDFEVSSMQEKKLISNARNNKQHYSPIFRSKNIEIVPTAIKQRFSLSREKPQVGLLDSNNFEIKKNYTSRAYEEPTLISKGSQQKLVNGTKHQKELDEFVKQKHQQTQTHFDSSRLKKLEKLKKNSKIQKEYFIDEDIKKENNEKQCQIDMKNELEQEMHTSEQNTNKQLQQQKSSGSLNNNTLMPIHLRYQYEKEFKEAKQKQQIQQVEQYSPVKKVSKDQIEEFFQTQVRHMKKKAEFFEKVYEKKLWEAQQIENEFQFKPVLNEYSCRILEKKQKGKKFDERIAEYQQNKQSKIDEQIQNSQPSFTPIISKKSRKIAENPKSGTLSNRLNIDSKEQQRTKTQES